MKRPIVVVIAFLLGSLLLIYHFVNEENSQTTTSSEGIKFLLPKEVTYSFEFDKKSRYNGQPMLGHSGLRTDSSKASGMLHLVSDDGLTYRSQIQLSSISSSNSNISFIKDELLEPFYLSVHPSLKVSLPKSYSFVASTFVKNIISFLYYPNHTAQDIYGPFHIKILDGSNKNTVHIEKTYLSADIERYSEVQISLTEEQQIASITLDQMVKGGQSGQNITNSIEQFRLVRNEKFLGSQLDSKQDIAVAIKFRELNLDEEMEDLRKKMNLNTLGQTSFQDLLSGLDNRENYTKGLVADELYNKLKAILFLYPEKALDLAAEAEGIPSDHDKFETIVDVLAAVGHPLAQQGLINLLSERVETLDIVACNRIIPSLGLMMEPSAENRKAISSYIDHNNAKVAAAAVLSYGIISHRIRDKYPEESHDIYLKIANELDQKDRRDTILMALGSTGNPENVKLFLDLKGSDRDRLHRPYLLKFIASQEALWLLISGLMTSRDQAETIEYLDAIENHMLQEQDLAQILTLLVKGTLFKGEKIQLRLIKLLQSHKSKHTKAYEGLHYLKNKGTTKQVRDSAMLALD